MAAGKSTTAEALALKLDKCVHLRGDVFRRMISSGREEMSAAPSEEAVRQLYLRVERHVPSWTTAVRWQVGLVGAGMLVALSNNWA